MKNLERFKIQIKWALIFALMTLVWMWIEKLVGLHDKYIAAHYIFTTFIIIPSVVIYVLALRDIRKNFYGGKMTYIQGFVSGLIISLIVTFLTPVTLVITTYVITPDYFSNIIDYTVESGEMTREEAAEYFNLHTYIMRGLVFAPLFGMSASAVIAIFTKKK